MAEVSTSLRSNASKNVEPANLNNKRLSGQQRLNTNHSEILLKALINSWTESDTARGIPFAVILFVCGYGDKMFFSVLKPSKWLAGLKEWACRSQVANCMKNSHQLSWNFFFEHTSWGNSLMFWRKWTGKFLFLCLSPYLWFYPETQGKPPGLCWLQFAHLRLCSPSNEPLDENGFWLPPALSKRKLSFFLINPPSHLVIPPCL